MGEAAPPTQSRGPSSVKAATSAGAITMISLCFANGLQGGEIQAFAQSTESLKHAFHVSDFALGVVPFSMAIVGNFASVPIAALCSRFPRTRVLAGMFALWAVLLGLTAMTPRFELLGLSSAGFLLFVIFRVMTSATEATDPAALPLIADYWPVEERAAKVGIFNAGAAVGAFGGIIAAGVIVDAYGWRWVFAMWVPIGLIGAALVGSRREPITGNQDAAYGDRLAASLDPEEILHDPVLAELIDPGTAHIASRPPPPPPAEGDRWAVVRTIVALKTFRWAALGIALTMVMQQGLANWGIAYFKRTFGLDGAQAGAMAPVLGVGTFLGILGGGFLADKMLKRGMVRARVRVTIIGYVGAAVAFGLAYSTRNIVIAAPFLGLGGFFGALPTGPQVALLMDVTPANLRSQTAAATNVLYAVSAIGPLLVGGLSTLFGDNLRLALWCVTPFYLIGAVLFVVASPTYVEDVAMVVADAEGRVEVLDAAEDQD